MKPFAIVVTGEPIRATFARRGGFPALIRDALGRPEVPFVEIDARESPLAALTGYAGVVVTGSAASVTERAPWMMAAEARLREAVAAGTPTFGICFGHQLLGQALGGVVAKNPLGREIGTVEVELVAPDPLFDGVEPPLLVNSTHVDAVVLLPPGARVLARSALDPNAAVRFGERAWGVQFHPEIDAGVLADYVAGRRSLIEAEGLDSARIQAGIGEGAAGRAALQRFVELALG